MPRVLGLHPSSGGKATWPTQQPFGEGVVPRWDWLLGEQPVSLLQVMVPLLFFFSLRLIPTIERGIIGADLLTFLLTFPLKGVYHNPSGLSSQYHPHSLLRLETCFPEPPFLSVFRPVCQRESLVEDLKRKPFLLGGPPMQQCQKLLSWLQLCRPSDWIQHILFFFNFYCYSITVVCLFSPSLHPTPAEHILRSHHKPNIPSYSTASNWNLKSLVIVPST